GGGRTMFNLRSVDLNLLTVFEAVYEAGTVTGAADRVRLSQSATSHALSRLRDACGDDLFVRVHQGLSPTPVAKAMYPVIKRSLEDLGKSLEEATGFDPARSQRQFRIAIPHPMAPFYALEVQAAAADVAPGIALTFDTTTRPVSLEDNLRAGVVDLAIDWLPISLDPFVNKKLFEDRFIFLARQDHPVVNTALTIEDLRNAKIVSLHPRRDIQYLPFYIRETHQQFQRNGIEPKFFVSEFLEIPTVVAGTDLLGPFVS